MKRYFILVESKVNLTFEINKRIFITYLYTLKLDSFKYSIVVDFSVHYHHTNLPLIKLNGSNAFNLVG